MPLAYAYRPAIASRRPSASRAEVDILGPRHKAVNAGSPVDPPGALAMSGVPSGMIAPSELWAAAPLKVQTLHKDTKAGVM